MRIERKRPSIYEAISLRRGSLSGVHSSPSSLPALLFFLAAGVLLGGAVAVIHLLQADVNASNKASLRTPGNPYVGESSSSSSSDVEALRLAWLMSFPNSGTSYTSELVRTAGRVKTASNYRSEDAGTTVPVFEDSPSGPFWTEFDNEETRLATDGYLLTKTHCGGYCVQCPPDEYMETPRSFLQHCLEGDRLVEGDTVMVDSYSKELVERAVHVIRDPFDNIVSRFHLARKNFEAYAVYPKSREGFRAFCAEMGDKFHHQEQEYPDIFEDVKDVPCHGDFYRYLQWHNMAFLTTWDLGIPSLIIHYENYTHSFAETKDSLLSWLEQEEIMEPTPFETGKTYRDFFTEEERQAVAAMFSKLAFKHTLEHTAHYFGSNSRNEKRHAASWLMMPLLP